jgi:hypothetical protein
LVRALKLFEGDREFWIASVQFVDDFELNLVISSAVMRFTEIDDLLLGNLLKKFFPTEFWVYRIEYANLSLKMPTD